MSNRSTLTFRIFAMDSPMHPLPLHTSATSESFPTNSSAFSQTVSVSGLGIRTPGLHWKRQPMNPVLPRTYARGILFNLIPSNCFVLASTASPAGSLYFATISDLVSPPDCSRIREWLLFQPHWGRWEKACQQETFSVQNMSCLLRFFFCRFCPGFFR